MQSECLHLILYQDAFEVKQRISRWQIYYHITGQVLTRCNLFFSATNKISSIFVRIWSIGQPVKDLKDLESNGLVLPNGQVRKGILHAIAGDNLGLVVVVGGILENFSLSVNLCRYCEIIISDRSSLQSHYTHNAVIQQRACSET